MYAILNVEVYINNQRFKRVAKVEVTKSAKVLEDTAVIELPTSARLERLGKFISNVETAKYFKVGHSVVIHSGYNGVLKEEFRGYVKRIKPGTPVVVECEDETFNLRKKQVKHSFKNTTLRGILEKILEGTGISLAAGVPDVHFNKFYIRNVNAAFALQKIKEDYGLLIYFSAEKELKVALAYGNDDVEVKYELGENDIGNGENLEWVDEADVRLKIKAVHIRKNNTRVEDSAGDEDGEQRTLYFYNIDDKKSLRQRAEQEILKYKYTGFKGNLKTFLVPRVEVGNVANVIDKHYAERTGKYIVDKVVTTIDGGGGRRKIELGLKVKVNGL